MLWAGIDTHLKMHRIEVQNDRGDAMLRGRVDNDRPGFGKLLDKLRLIEKSNNQQIGAVFMNPTGNYHVPVRAYLQSAGFRVILVDVRVSEHIRMTENLGREKSDAADASVLASTARLKPSVLKSDGHERLQLSAITRLANSLKISIARLMNQIKSDLAAVFPEYPFYDSIDSKTSMAILGMYATAENIRNTTLQDLFQCMSTASRKHYKLQDAESLLGEAVKSIGISDPDGVYAYRIRMNVERLMGEKNRLAVVEEEIIRLSGNNVDIVHISEIRGMSRTASAVIVSEIGDISQFQSAVKLQAYGGKSPNISGSGGKVRSTGVTKIRNPYLSNTVFESSVSMVAHRTPEFLEIFNREIGKGKKPTQAYIVVGKRLLYHVYSIMKNKKPYRERRQKGGGRSVSSGAAS